MGILWGRWSPLCESTKPGFVSQAEREETPSSEHRDPVWVQCCQIHSEGSWGSRHGNKGRLRAGWVSIQKNKPEEKTEGFRLWSSGTVSARQRRFGGSGGDRRLHRKPHQTTRSYQKLSIHPLSLPAYPVQGLRPFPACTERWDSTWADYVQWQQHFKTDYSFKCVCDSMHSVQSKYKNI